MDCHDPQEYFNTNISQMENLTPKFFQGIVYFCTKVKGLLTANITYCITLLYRKGPDRLLHQMLIVPAMINFSKVQKIPNTKYLRTIIY